MRLFKQLQHAILASNFELLFAQFDPTSEVDSYEPGRRTALYTPILLSHTRI
jgi:hypothetical protein